MFKHRTVAKTLKKKFWGKNSALYIHLKRGASILIFNVKLKLVQLQTYQLGYYAEHLHKMPFPTCYN